MPVVTASGSSPEPGLEEEAKASNVGDGKVRHYKVIRTSNGSCDIPFVSLPGRKSAHVCVCGHGKGRGVRVRPLLCVRDA